MEDEPPDPVYEKPRDRPPILVLGDVPIYIRKLEELNEYAFSLLYDNSRFEERVDKGINLINNLDRRIKYLNNVLIKENLGISPIKGGIPIRERKELANLSKVLKTRKKSLEEQMPNLQLSLEES